MKILCRGATWRRFLTFCISGCNNVRWKNLIPQLSLHVFPLQSNLFTIPFNACCSGKVVFGNFIRIVTGVHIQNKRSCEIIGLGLKWAISVFVFLTILRIICIAYQLTTFFIMRTLSIVNGYNKYFEQTSNIFLNRTCALIIMACL